MQDLVFNPWVATGFYGAFAMFALLATWCKEGKAQVGGMLMVCWLVSLALWAGFPVEWRPAVFPILDTLVALTAAKAAKETGSRVPIALIALSVMAIAASTAFSISGAGSWRQVVTYEITLNVIFVFQCVITGCWGVADALGRVTGFGARPRTNGGPAESFRNSDDP